MRNALIAVLVIALAGMLVCSAVSCSKEKKAETVQSAGKAASSQRTEGKGVAVKINGKAVTDEDLTQETAMLMAQMGGQATPAQMESMRGALRNQALDNIISRTLLEEQAAKEDIKIAAADVDARMDEIKKQFPSEDAFAQKLASLGMSAEGIRSNIESGLKVEALLKKHTPEVKPPTDADVRAFYDGNPDRFLQPERIRASHILVAFAKDDTDAQKAEKRARAAKLLADLRGGADFAQLASQNSDCPSKQRGGDLGYFQKGQMVGPFEEAAFALKPGQMTDIVQTDFGYHIIKVVDHTEARNVPFEEAKTSISTYLDGQDKNAAITNYIASLRAAAKVELPDSTGKLREVSKPQ